MDSKEMFFNTILAFYNKIAEDRIPSELIVGVSQRVAAYYFEEYTRFREQYPKSVKRYSTFSVEDLNHPYTSGLVVDFFKEKLQGDYVRFSKILLKMNEIEIRSFEQSREDYLNMM